MGSQRNHTAIAQRVLIRSLPPQGHHHAPAATSQITGLGLMAKKIMVSHSTSGDVPESGLDVLNQNGDSVEVALARLFVQ